MRLWGWTTRTVKLGGGTDPALLEPYANLRAYRSRCLERPAWRKAVAAYQARVKAG